MEEIVEERMKEITPIITWEQYHHLRVIIKANLCYKQTCCILTTKYPQHGSSKECWRLKMARAINAILLFVAQFWGKTPEMSSFKGHELNAVYRKRTLSVCFTFRVMSDDTASRK